MVSTNPPRRKGRQTQAQRRGASERRVIEATIELIAERGSTQISFADIAKKAGCSRTLPGYLFGTKDVLLAELVRYAEQQSGGHASDGSVETDSPFEALSTWIRAEIPRITSDTPLMQAWPVLRAESMTDGSPLRDGVQQADGVGERFIRERLDEAQRVGEVDAHVDVETAAMLVYAIIQGLGLRQLRQPGSWSAHTAADVIVTGLAAYCGYRLPHDPGRRPR